MSKKSLITAFSLSKETNNLLKSLQTKFGKSRSELLREMINYYVSSVKKESTTIAKNDFIDDSDANKVLKLYYQLLGGTSPKPTIVIGVGIIAKKDKVLIGLRKESDKNVKDLRWTFPSGKFDNLDFETSVIKTIKDECGYDSKIIRLLHARLIPDSPNKKIRVIAMYYHCKIISGTQKPGRDFKELKWVTATEVNRHFTTSVSDEIMNFLGTL